MADKPASERTEQATPERLRKARQEGQIPNSEEVPTALIVGALVVVLMLTAPSLFLFFKAQIRDGMSLRIAAAPGGVGLLQSIFKGGWAALGAATPVMVIVMIVSVMASLLTSGWSFSTKALEIKFDRLNPISGMKNLISGKSVVKLVISIAKMAVMGIILWQYLSSQLSSILGLHFTTPEGLIVDIGRLVLGVSSRVVAAMLVIAMADLLYQRWNYKSQMKMTRQEVKEERKQYELPGEVKGRMRGMAIAMMKKRMAKSVPTADVIIVNPTHYAVALKYDAGRMAAPTVVAKGVDHFCQTIKEIAAKHGVPIVEKPELARALYASCKEGHAVPESLFVAVAEVLAMIYRVGRKRKSYDKRV